MDSLASHLSLDLLDIYPPVQTERDIQMSKNFKVSYDEFDTREQAEQAAKRETARSFRSQDIWQKVATTVVPEIDVQINSKSVDIEDVK